MLPHITQFGSGEGGIRRVVEAYNKYLPEFGIEYVPLDATSYDLTAVHAGAGSGADVAHNHGLHWTEDKPPHPEDDYEWQANAAVIASLREAKQITVPSQWVAETIRRDMRVDPHVIGHGIEWEEWQTPYGDYDNDYVLWNKNREVDVCNPEAVTKLAHLFPQTLFRSTFAPPNEQPTTNVQVTGQVPFEQMRQFVLGCAVYLSSVKETFGIGVLEAMAAEKPILGWANGGNLDLVQHGVNGYLAQPGNYEDLANGLDYCLEHRATLGANGREMARAYTWRSICEQVARVYELAYNEPPISVGVVIPVYNKNEAQITRAIASCLDQSYLPEKIVVVNDGSTDTLGIDAARSKLGDNRVVFMDMPTNQGVAAARNAGIRNLKTTLIACLDGDDWLGHFFLGECITELKKDPSIGIAYTGIQWHDHETGVSEVSAWPVAYSAGPQFNYEERQNQIPTCAVFRRDAWARVGGYRPRYCPNGAGSEDAAFWTQVLSVGYTAKQVTADPLFNYSVGGQVGGDKNYQEIDWLAWLPFSRDRRYPFACSVSPSRYSHPVRQYDEPELSIVIPVGADHEDDLRTALDSIEGQHFRNWEVIVIFDTGNEYYPELTAAYPYVKWGSTGGGKGPGYARNRGAEMAKGHLLFFLDADDFLNPAEPNSLGEMLQEFHNTGNGIYSQHIGRAVVSPEYAKYVEKEGRLLAFNEHLGQAYILNRGIEFDCDRAFREPGTDPNKIYIWGLISTLIPRQWHFDIGGFDESMPTWEDWDYWLRMAKGGRCFSRIQKPFIIYNYISGNRRERGLQIWGEVLQYLREKHEGIQIVGCGCSGSNKKTGEEIVKSAEGHVMAKYIWPNIGRHDIGFGLGRHLGAGLEPPFLVPKDVAENNPHKFEIVPEATEAIPQPQAIGADPAPISPPPPPQTLTSPDGGFAWTSDEEESGLDLSGFSVFIQRQLADGGLSTKEAIKKAGADGLQLLKGIGPATAKKIMELAE